MSLAVNTIFSCYFFYVLCRIVPKVKVVLDAVPEEELAAERYLLRPDLSAVLWHRTTRLLRALRWR